jgi:DNA-binding NtrC family response regulator
MSCIPRVLVIDDELLVVQSLRLVLSSEFQVEGTTHAEQGLEWITSGKSYDVILCDIMMPGLNGVALRDKVHAVSPDQAARIVFITGGLVVPEVRAMLDHVTNTVLEKPIDLDGLRELIRRRVRSTWSLAASEV